jgi:hypothetical protein
MKPTTHQTKTNQSTTSTSPTNHLKVFNQQLSTVTLSAAFPIERVLVKRWTRLIELIEVNSIVSTSVMQHTDTHYGSVTAAAAAVGRSKRRLAVVNYCWFDLPT